MRRRFASMRTLPILLAALCAATPALAQGPAPMVSRPGLASIDDAAGGGIRDFYAVDARGIYLRDRTNRWYYAAFSGPCPGILYDARIEFVTDASRRLDRSSRIRTETMTCGIAALDHSAPPADKGGRD